MSNWANSKSEPLPSNWHSLKKEVLRRDGPRCARCSGYQDLELDHIIPRSEGGTDHLSNLQLLCGKDARNCHGEKTREDRIKYKKKR